MYIRILLMSMLYGSCAGAATSNQLELHNPVAIGSSNSPVSSSRSNSGSPVHVVLDLTHVGRNESVASLASQLTARHCEALAQSTSPDRSARLAQEFQRDVQSRTLVPPADVATPAARNSDSSPHTSSDEDEHTSTSDTYSSRLERIIKNQEIQLVAQTKMTVFYQVGREEERERNASQLRHVIAGYTLSAIGILGMIGFGIVPFLESCG